MKHLLNIFLVLFIVPLCCQAENEIKVGAMLCLTGICATTGNASLKGAELAISELNTMGGILGRKIVLSVQDTKEAESASGSVTAFNNLALDPKIKLFLGPTWTNGGLPLAPILSKRPDVIAISPSLGVADFNETASNLFNLWPHDDISAKGLAAVAIRKGWKNAAIVSAQDSWALAQAESFSNELIKLGGHVSITVEPLPGARDLRIECLKLVTRKPDVVLFTLWSHMQLAAKELRSLKYAGGLMAIQIDKAGVAAANGSLEGTIFAQFPESNPEFVKRYMKQYGESPSLSADTSYDSIMLIARAAERAGTLDVQALKMEMPKTEFQGASGKIALDDKRAIIREPSYFTVAGDKFKRIDGDL